PDRCRLRQELPAPPTGQGRLRPRQPVPRQPQHPPGGLTARPPARTRPEAGSGGGPPPESPEPGPRLAPWAAGAETRQASTSAPTSQQERNDHVGSAPEVVGAVAVQGPGRRSAGCSRRRIWCRGLLGGLGLGALDPGAPGVVG